MRHRCLRIKAGTFALLSAATGLFAVGLLSPFNVHAQSKTPSVVASIKPIHSLVSNVMSGIGKPGIIISGGASPHAYTIRPSKAKLLNKADMIFWIGNEMETFLEKPLHSLGRMAKIIELSKAHNVYLLKARKSGTWDSHDHGDQHNHGHSHKSGTSPGRYNMHLWLSRTNAIAIVNTAVKALGKFDPKNAALYESNGSKTIERIQNVFHRLKSELAPVRNAPYLVFHDAYPYFEKDMGLNAVGSISTHTGRKPGAKRLYTIRRKILTLGVKCIFAEPQFEPGLIKTIVEGTSAKTSILDPLGATLKAGPDAYFTLLENLTKNLKDCLAKTS